MVNFLALLGWSPGNDVELMALQEMIGLFDTTRLLKTASVFDEKKLEWMNGQHIMRTTAAELATHLAPLWRNDGKDPAWLSAEPDRVFAVIELNKQRARTTLQLADQVRVFFERPDLAKAPPTALKLLDAPLAKSALTAIRDALHPLNLWTIESIHTTLGAVPAALNAKAGDVFQPLRAALTGSNASAEIYGVVHLMGREESVARIDAALARA
jgi:glutamyl-tRNA synthetase